MDSMLAMSRTRKALTTVCLMPLQNPGVSSPWSCTTFIPQRSTALEMKLAGLLTNTPEVTM